MKCRALAQASFPHCTALRKMSEEGAGWAQAGGAEGHLAPCGMVPTIGDVCAGASDLL